MSDLSSWGRISRDRGRRSVSADAAHLGASSKEGSLLPYGNGRSYGDSCLNDFGMLIDSRRRNAVLRFDTETGVLAAEAGILLSEITRHVAPLGWFLPVTPGTQFVTLGGAIANDVHGKNHHRRGTFGRWVRSLELRRSDRGTLQCSPDVDTALFAASIGGMGLAGLIVAAEIQLIRVPSLTIAQTTTRFENLGGYFRMAEAVDEQHEYAVAWIDTMSRGAAFGRGHLLAGDHAVEGDRTGIGRPPFASVPLTPPLSPLRGLPLKAFNSLVFRKAPAGTSRRDVLFDSFFYPLDRIGQWNRLYGPNGLHQHQSCIPLADHEAVVHALLECARAHGQGSFLTVLKRFGSLPSPGLLSFPGPGYTLTLDFPHRGEKTLRMLADLDRLTIEAGGRVNPYKDARMSAETFAAGFPDWAALEALRDPAMMSDFWRRTAGRLARP